MAVPERVTVPVMADPVALVNPPSIVTMNTASLGGVPSFTSAVFVMEMVMISVPVQSLRSPLNNHPFPCSLARVSSALQ